MEAVSQLRSLPLVPANEHARTVIQPLNSDIERVNKIIESFDVEI
jgi:hypothetical protein